MGTEKEEEAEKEVGGAEAEKVAGGGCRDLSGWRERGEELFWWRRRRRWR